MASPSRTVAGLTLLGVALGVGACGSSTPQVARDVSRPGGRGDAKDSLFRAANLRRALERVRRRTGPAGAVTSLKLEAGAVTLLVQKGAAAESVVVTKRLALTHVAAPPGANQPPVPLSKVDAATPERIAAAIGQRTGTSLADIDFFALDHEPGSAVPRWLVYLRRGLGTFAAGLSGADLKAVGATGTTTTPSPPPAASPTTPSTTTTPSTAPTTPAAPSAGPRRQPPNCLRLSARERSKNPVCAKPTIR